MEYELKHDTRNKKWMKLYKNVYRHCPHCLLCHSDKYFQVKIKHLSYYKNGNFNLNDFHFEKLNKLKNCNILI